MMYRTSSPRLNGFTLIEVLAIVSSIVILSAVIMVRLGNMRAAASWAELESNVSELQFAYDRAVLMGESQLYASNSIPEFERNAYTNRFLATHIKAEQLAQITVTTGTQITNGTALFGIANTNTSPPQNPYVAITSPSSNSKFSAGTSVPVTIGRCNTFAC